MINIAILLQLFSVAVCIAAAPSSDPVISGFYSVNVRTHLFESVEPVSNAADVVIDLDVDATGAVAPARVASRELIHSATHSVVLNSDKFLSVSDHLQRVTLMRRDECGVVTTDRQRCYFFDDCPQMLPSVFPSLRFAQFLGRLDQVPSTLQSHLSSFDVLLKPNFTSSIDHYSPEQIDVLAIHFDAADVNLLLADGQIRRMIIGAGLLRDPQAVIKRPRELVIDILDATFIHVNLSTSTPERQKSDLAARKKATASLKPHADIDELATRTRCKESGKAVVRPNPVHGNMTGGQQAVPITGQRLASMGDLDERLVADHYTIELSFRFWPEIGMLPLWDEAIYQEAGDAAQSSKPAQPTPKPAASTSKSKSNKPAADTSKNGVLFNFLKWAFALED